jgi:hypothetical protein
MPFENSKYSGSGYIHKPATVFNEPTTPAQLADIKPTTKPLRLPNSGVNTGAYHDINMFNASQPINTARPIKYSPHPWGLSGQATPR